MQAWIQGGADKNLEWRGTETDEKHTGAGGSADVQRRVRVTVEFHGAHTSKGQTAQRSPLGGTRCSDRVRRGALQKHFFFPTLTTDALDCRHRRCRPAEAPTTCTSGVGA